MFGIPMGISMCGGYGFMAFEQSSLSVSANEPLDPQEAKWISDIMRGGLILAKNEWKGYGGQYDFTNITEREFTFLSTMNLGEIGTEENEILNSYDNKSDNVIQLDTNIDWVKMKI
ncbi:8698_t:CDS:2 [Entrophospora sp. SA101]|nr:8698_t:CDS:2 [Entrophospora sp. SA101]